MLKAFTPRNHSNLVKLLCTFRYRREYYLMFPYAESNLRQYWQNYPTPGLSMESSRWVLSQCKAIASALHLVHEYQNTFEHACLPEDMDNDQIYGRHGDIKPENILLAYEDVTKTPGRQQERILLIADFGLMDLHRRLTRSLIAPDKINGSPSYEPPEIHVGKEVSRAYDIWSLGCVFLELLVWLALGWNGLEEFTLSRQEKGRNGLTDYKFYTAVTGTKAKIHESVQRWIKRLRIDTHYSLFLKDLLDIVSEDMLVVDPVKRIRCGPLNERLGDLMKKAKNDSGFFEKPTVI